MTATPISKIKKMIEQSLNHEMDPSNFRKGIHTLKQRNFLNLVREENLSISISLTAIGRTEAEKIHKERTDEISEPKKIKKDISIESIIKNATAGLLNSELQDLFICKFKSIASEFSSSHNFTSQQAFESVFLKEVLAFGESSYLNVRIMRNIARNITT